MQNYSTDSLLLLSMPGGTEWLWIILAILILFGGKKIPDLARGLGKGIREFKDAKEGISQEFNNAMKEKHTNNKETIVDASVKTTN